MLDSAVTGRVWASGTTAVYVVREDSPHPTGVATGSRIVGMVTPCPCRGEHPDGPRYGFMATHGGEPIVLMHVHGDHLADAEPGEAPERDNRPYGKRRPGNRA